MTKLVITLILSILFFLLGCTPLFGTSRKQSRAKEQGMSLMIRPRTTLILLATLAVLIFLATFFFVLGGVKGGSASWEEDAQALISLMAFGTAFPILLLLIDYLFYANHVLYNQEKILIGRAFRGYEEIWWTELERMEVLSSERFCLYDREGRRRLSANSSFENYGDFRRLAQQQCRPEQLISSEHETGYQRRFAVRSGQGILRRKAGEFFLIPAAYLLFLTLIPVKNGASFAEALPSWFSLSESAAVPALVFLPALFFLAIPFLMLAQQIDYDTQELIVRRFPRRTLNLRWSDVRRIEIGKYHLEKYDANTCLRVTLHYGDNRKFTIYQHRFRRGFPEFEEFLPKVVERYGILEEKEGRQ